MNIMMSNYTMRLGLNNYTILSKDIALAHNEAWVQPKSYVLNKPGDRQKLGFLLYREFNFTSPDRDLHLWINVSE
jgi:uncharacterized membrane protein